MAMLARSMATALMIPDHEEEPNVEALAVCSFLNDSTL